ncbi:hypothetical protein EHM69_11580 [candidate division KSB1 bacterium]|nr:MAG: hypothetical protein EHM69_11580 [candidate division KSB1 bacterium]
MKLDPRTTALFTAAVILFVVMIGCGPRAKEIPEGTFVTILYTSDVHSKLEGCGCSKMGGGITRRSAELLAAREEDPAVVYCDAGNFMSGTPAVDKSKGQISVAVYNEMKTSVANISERELTFGVEAFKEAQKESKFKYVSANLRYNGSRIAEAFVVKQVKEARIAFIGLCGTINVMRSDTTFLPYGVSVEDPVKSAQAAVAAAKDKADAIVILSTCGDAMDSLIAQTLPDVNLIIGGRSYRANAATPWVVGETRIVRTEREGRVLGKMILIYGAEKKIKSFAPRAITMENSGRSDPQMLELVRSFIPDFADNPKEAKTAVGDSKR